MRLARFAVAGLTLGIFAGFAAALLRPRSRLAGNGTGIGPSRSIMQGSGQPIVWGSRPAKAQLPPLVPVVPKGPVGDRSGSTSSRASRGTISGGER
jgi:hypothetical protein